jgi:hypothetical protein
MRGYSLATIKAEFIDAGFVPRVPQVTLSALAPLRRGFLFYVDQGDADAEGLLLSETEVQQRDVFIGCPLSCSGVLLIGELLRSDKRLLATPPCSQKRGARDDQAALAPAVKCNPSLGTLDLA